MSYLIEYEPEAIADLEKLTQTVRERIVKRLIGWLRVLTKSTHYL
jgi:mRNA-degrading endonuclease RelE of RelBE toxin-antitoxin system